MRPQYFFHVKDQQATWQTGHVALQEDWAIDVGHVWSLSIPQLSSRLLNTYPCRHMVTFSIHNGTGRATLVLAISRPARRAIINIAMIPPRYYTDQRNDVIS